MTVNPLVEFLAAYGPQPSSNNLYDEFVVEASERTGCAPIEIKQPLVAELGDLLRSDSPKSVILTGTAGDGKTFTARRVVEELSGGGIAWQNTDKVFDLPNPPLSDRRFRFIKDLSELNEDDKDAIYPEILASLTGESTDFFVICVNDGHLLKFFRDREGEGDGLHAKLADMLRRDESEDTNGRFRLINMSRQFNLHPLDQILDGIANHPNWSACGGCPALTDAEKRCPIRCNLDILQSREPGSVRERLKDMIQMAAADGRHLSIRQLILLAVNILLGDGQPRSRLLTCQKAKNRAAEGKYGLTNPYVNAFGDNLPEGERDRYGAFDVLGRFQVGFETSNYFDNSLLWQENDLPGDENYGAKLFETLRGRYLDDSDDDPVKLAEFKRAMINQRRRLFFSIDPGSAAVRDEPRRDPWNLTAFVHGASYIAMANALRESEERPQMPSELRQRLFRGLNRVMTGEMTATDDQLWLTALAGVFRGKEIPLLVQRVGPPAAGRSGVKFRLPHGGGPPLLQVTAAETGNDSGVNLALRPTLVECLWRISDGALPACFPVEFAREVERFQLRADATRDRLGAAESVPREVDMDASGKLQESTIAVLSDEGAW